MATSNQRLPTRSELITILTAVAIPIHVWALFRIVAGVPQWLLRLTPWQLVGVVSYSLMLTLIETVMVVLFVLLVIALVSRRRLHPVLVPAVTVFAGLTTALMVALLLIPLRDGFSLILTLVGYVVLLVASLVLVGRSKRLAGMLNGLVDRLVPLALLYIFFDVLATVIVIVRNLFA